MAASSELLPKHSKAGIKDRNTSQIVFLFQSVTISAAGLKSFKEKISVGILRVNADIFMVSGFI
jgi:hypothetical protein